MSLVLPLFFICPFPLALKSESNESSLADIETSLELKSSSISPSLESNPSASQNKSCSSCACQIKVGKRAPLLALGGNSFLGRLTGYWINKFTGEESLDSSTFESLLMLAYAFDYLLARFFTTFSIFTFYLAFTGFRAFFLF